MAWGGSQYNTRCTTLAGTLPSSSPPRPQAAGHEVYNISQLPELRGGSAQVLLSHLPR